MSHGRARTGLEIAIIGLAGRFPGARDLEDFWRNLRDGRESITFFTAEELEAAGTDARLRSRPDFVNAHAVLPDVDRFDAGLFGYTPREAEILDPQQRLFLECAWEALEDAGYAPGHCRFPVGVYAGAGFNTYLVNNLLANPAALQGVGGFQAVLGNDKDFLASRAAYKLDLRGPAVTVQTACSTSLVAVHLACQGLLNGECELALAGGVSLQVPQVAGYLWQEGGLFSPDGHCRAFDERAAGTLAGSGVGLVALKRLEDALADGDHIEAVILGSGINNDGADRVGYTAPSVSGQAKLIRDVHVVSGVDPDSITYMEAHGTATALGDAVEVAALTRAFREGTSRQGYCALGALKTNVGHLDAAAGVAGLIKTVLALQHRTLPPTLHFTAPNPQLALPQSPFYVPTTALPWEPPPGTPRRAGVSSFGLGGTNAHVTLEEAPAPTARPAGREEPQLLLLSARSEAALEAATDRLAAHLAAHPELRLEDVAWTTQLGRASLPRRRFAVCANTGAAAAALARREAGPVFTGAAPDTAPGVVFLFPGGGAQYAGMGRSLYQREPVYREAVNRCSRRLGIDLALAAADAERAELALPALFATEYALAQLWMSWGIQPRAMVGHSLGEWVAACLAGVLGLEDALDLVALRGRLLAGLPAGAMLSVPLPEAEVTELLGDDLSLAGVNGPASCVVSGPSAAVERQLALLQARGVEARRLHLAAAAHSRLLDPFLGDFRDAVARLELGEPRIPYTSNLTGAWITATEATDPGYWAKQLRSTVRFHDCLRTALTGTELVLLEVGPGNTLATLARPLAREARARDVVSCMPRPEEDLPERTSLLTALGRLWVAGAEIDWRAMDAAAGRRRVRLPPYPFDRQRYWIEPGATPAGAAPARLPSTEWFQVPVWRQVPAPPPLHPRELTAAQGTWLVFMDTTGVGEELVGWLREAGADLVEVEPGKGFSHPAPDRCVLRPDAPEDYAALAQALAGAGRTARYALHLWGCEAAAPARDELRLGLHSLLCLGRAFGERSPEARLDIVAVATGLHALSNDDVPRPGAAAALAPCLVLPQEYAGLSCRSLELPAGKRRGAWIGWLMAELLAGEGPTVLAWRGGRRWVSGFEPLATERRSSLARRVRPGGVYLITGGLGGVGLCLAEALAETAPVRLVLTGRDPRRNAPRVEALRRLGAEVMTAGVDVADVEAMRGLLREIEARFGGLHGVVHAAGVAGGGLIRVREPAQLEQELRPKVLGTLVLDELLRDRELDFLVLCSSMNALVGGLGQVAYCAGNIFLDAYARSRAQSARYPVVSVNWGRWAGVGMAVQVEAMHESLSGEKLGGGMSPAEGKASFLRLPLEPDLPQFVVSPEAPGALVERVRAATRLASAEAFSANLHSPAAPTHARPALGSPYVEPGPGLERTIAGTWEELIGISGIGAQDDFFELGGHSLLALKIIGRLREEFRVELPLRGFFEAPTVAGLATLVESRLIEQVEAMSDEEVGNRLR